MSQIGTPLNLKTHLRNLRIEISTYRENIYLYVYIIIYHSVVTSCELLILFFDVYCPRLDSLQDYSLNRYHT